MVRSHARTLTLMIEGLLAGARAYFLLSVRLENVDVAETLQSPVYEIIEPRFR